jgi:hypothetical protein
MRTSFELKFVAENLEEAKKEALSQISGFLDITEEEISDKVDMEFKVSYPKAETVAEIEAAVNAKIFQITVYGTLKQSVTKPFGQ